MTATERTNQVYKLSDLHVDIAQDATGQTVTPSYSIGSNATRVQLNSLLGKGVVLHRRGEATCQNCGDVLRLPLAKSAKTGHCYSCFTTLASCDLCIVSPDRCHFHRGTCRDPQWGESFCMQPHIVYLAVTSGPKVGITRAPRLWRRWVDQGAEQALAIVHAPTRRSAGVVEAYLRRYVNDRTDWKRLVRGDRTRVDLPRLCQQLRGHLASFEVLSDGGFTAQVSAEEISQLRWCDEAPVIDIQHPIASYSPAKRIHAEHQTTPVKDNLCGVLGHFLLLSNGVFDISEHRGMPVDIEIVPPFVAAELVQDQQGSLFDI